MKDKNIERIIRTPRVRMSDCKRLAFFGGSNIKWVDIDDAPEIYPIYPIPPMLRKSYDLGGSIINIRPEMTINDLVREIIGLVSFTGDCYLHTMTFYKDGRLEIKYEELINK